ncbi:RNase A-like domain-containing protein [Candidatus Uabimicrobium amorphum]|uniref:Lipoprotein n=1 Tax=Uabimicrobium amorphum TaxID=2596890 RepID=A0A5S9INS0_UABAM|nr:RNase A-like domain-containing protein [Candidatus Uabimicrobium amorphum]BBM84712.1 lipoprotein [Candidatus Uabimicrobium amorphum]
MLRKSIYLVLFCFLFSLSTNAQDLKKLQELTDGIVAKKIPKIDIDDHEGWGHTVAKHVAKKDKYLKKRLKKDGLKAASSFEDKKAAGSAAKRVFNKNVKDIKKWWTKTTKVKETFTADLKVKGYVFFKEKPNQRVEITKKCEVILVLKRNTKKGVAYILTCYPKAKASDYGIK